MEMADAVIAVSQETKADIMRLFNVAKSASTSSTTASTRTSTSLQARPTRCVANGIDPAVPYVLFVGRIARQKGIIHLVNAIQYLTPGFQVVLCAGAPDTPEIAAEMKAAVAAAQAKRIAAVVWIEQMLDKKHGDRALRRTRRFSAARRFTSRSASSISRPWRARRRWSPAPSAASKRWWSHGETGFLVPIEQMTDEPFEPVNPDKFARDLAARLNECIADPALCERFGKAGRSRATEKFSWSAIAQQTADLYATLHPSEDEALT